MTRNLWLAVVAGISLFAFAADAQTCTGSSAALCIDPISWNIIGLDSNAALAPKFDGPDTFMVGARACNKSATTVTNVVATYNTVGLVNPYINLADNSTISVPELRPGRCEDFYFNGRITRTAAAFFTSQGYIITATATGALPAVTPANRSLYVESLISQNRNTIGDVTGPNSLQVGGIYNFHVTWSTAEGGYEQLEHFLSLVNTSFRLLSSYSTYEEPVGAINTTIYADGCGWDNNTLSPTYRSCNGGLPDGYPGGKTGGTVDTYFVVQILGSTPAQGSNIKALIYDFSGSSYHYNTDFNFVNSGLVVVANSASDMRVTISDSPDPVLAGATITYTGTVTNGGLSPVTTTDNGFLKIPVPPDTTFTSITMPGWTCGVAGGVITCNPSATFTSGSSASYTLLVTVAPGTVAGTTIQATASVGSNHEDPTPSNNVAQTTTLVASSTQADLVVTNTVPPSVVQGSAFTYTQTVTNNGPAVATSPTFTTSIPAGSTFSSITAPAGWTCGAPVGSSITCTSSTALALNASAVFSLNLIASGTAGTNLSSTAYASTATIEPTTQNNIATASTNIVAAGSADMAITVSDFPDPVVAGESILYTQSVTNNGVVPALDVTVSFPIPANTAYSYLDAPAGWTCSTYPLPGFPTPGATTGTITCTKASVAVGETASFPLTMSVAAATPVGTVINYTATVASLTADSVPANNTSSASTLVGSPTTADVMIQKTTSSNPIRTGANLLYNLQVTNNGPATANGVTVSDPLPANVTFVSATSTRGDPCTYNAVTRTVSCNIGFLTNGQIAVITIRVTVDAAASGQTLNNVATVSSSNLPGDPVLSNNTSAAPVTVITATAVTMLDFEATRSGNDIDLRWKTSSERNNLGFNIYREVGSARTKVNASLIAGTLLAVGTDTRAGFSYRWTDRAPVSGAVYWIEAVDVRGKRDLTGPVLPRLATSSATADAAVSQLRNAPTLADLNLLTASSTGGRIPDTALLVRADAANDVTLARQFDLAGQRAAKVMIAREGYYRVTRSQLTAAGFDAGTDPRALSLFVDAQEIPISVTDGGDGRFDDADYLEFYAYGMDTAYSGKRAYWLVAGNNGLRFKPKAKVKGAPITATSFPFTLERKDRRIFFGAQRTGTDNDSFYGPVIWSEPSVQKFDVSNLAPAGGPVTLHVAVQGATYTAHRVRVSLNGAPVGVVEYRDQELGRATFTLPASALRAGINEVSLVAVADPLDISFTDVIRLTYPHAYAADANVLRFPVTGGREATVTGFTTANVRVVDVTDPAQPQEVEANLVGSGSSYSLVVIPHDRGERTLYATAISNATTPAAIVANTPSSWSSRQNRAGFVIIAHADFIDAVAPLVAKREAEGIDTVVVNVQDVFDEFGYGSKSPEAIREFLRWTRNNWSTAPTHAMLVGDATWDPRNYVGYGDRDFIPTRFLPTIYMKAASDDWLADFDGDGVPNIYLGRLPVRTQAEAHAIVDKLVSYQPATARRTLIVVDKADPTFSFANAAIGVRNTVPPEFGVETFPIVDASGRSALIAAMRTSPTIVNYIGHGSIQGWSNTAIFGIQDVSSLAGSGAGSFYVLMNCLNGMFADAYVSSLGEMLLAVPNGGAIAVWTSSAMSDPPPQTTINQALYRILAANPSITIGELVARAKASTSDRDVRTTWMLMGDPTLRLH